MKDEEFEQLSITTPVQLCEKLYGWCDNGDKEVGTWELSRAFEHIFVWMANDNFEYVKTFLENVDVTRLDAMFLAGMGRVTYFTTHDNEYWRAYVKRAYDQALTRYGKEVVGDAFYGMVTKTGDLITDN